MLGPEHEWTMDPQHADVLGIVGDWDETGLPKLDGVIIVDYLGWYKPNDCDVNPIDRTCIDRSCCFWE